MLEMLFSRFSMIPTLAYPLQILSLKPCQLACGHFQGQKNDNSRASHILNIHRTTPHNLRIPSRRRLYMVKVCAGSPDHGASTVHAVRDQPRRALQDDMLIVSAKVGRWLRIGARIEISCLRAGGRGGGE